jgi:hypothetical protein
MKHNSKDLFTILSVSSFIMSLGSGYMVTLDYDPIFTLFTVLFTLVFGFSLGTVITLYRYDP